MKNKEEEEKKMVVVIRMVRTHKRKPKPLCGHEGVTVLWNQGVHTDREVIANRPDVIIENKKKENTVYCHAKRSSKSN